MYEHELGPDGNAKLDHLFLLLVNEYCQAMETGWCDNEHSPTERANARGFAFGISYAHGALDHRVPCHSAILQRIIMFCSRLYIR